MHPSLDGRTTSKTTSASSRLERWPALPLASWQDTYDTLHLYAQIVGKIQLALTPLMNEWWNVVFFTNARGLTTTPMPVGDRTFELAFDFVEQALVARMSDGTTRQLPLRPCSVAEFYRNVFGLLRSIDVDVTIDPMPAEIPNATPCDTDTAHAAYDAAAVSRWWQIVRQLDVVLKQFRAGFIGKSSPVHFWWGSFDLAVTRFSGRIAPPRDGADRITRIAYDREVYSVGFWPGGGPYDDAALYAYAAPEPAGFASAQIAPREAVYVPDFKEYVLPYEVVRRAKDPAAMVLAFAESTYEAAATLGKWDRAQLEWEPDAAKH